MTGSGRSSRMPTVISRPSTNRSMRAVRPDRVASSSPSDRRDRSRWTETPTLEPSARGLMTRGKPSERAQASSPSGPPPRVSTWYAGVSIPALMKSRFDSSLSIARRVATGREPVYGTRLFSSSRWISPSSPKRPWSARNATSAFTPRSSSPSSRCRSISATVWPSPARAMAAARPERSETSRSDEGPPMRTATEHLLFMATSPNEDFEFEGDAVARRNLGADAVDEPQDIIGRGAAFVDDEVRVLAGDVGGARARALEAARVDEHPRLRARRVLEDAARVRAAQGLRVLLVLQDAVVGRGQGRGIDGGQLEPGAEDDAAAEGGRAVPESRLPPREAVRRPVGFQDVDPADGGADLAVAPARVHDERAGDAAGDAREALEAGEPAPRGLLHQPREARASFHGRRPVAPPRDGGEPVEAQDRAVDARVADEEVAAAAEKADGDVALAGRRERVGGLVRSLGLDEPPCGAADAERRAGGERVIRPRRDAALAEK